jgi:hypothetical protein
MYVWTSGRHGWQGPQGLDFWFQYALMKTTGQKNSWTYVRTTFFTFTHRILEFYFFRQITVILCIKSKFIKLNWTHHAIDS